MQKHTDFNLRLNLSDKIIRLIGKQRPPSATLNSGDLETTQQKQIYITKLVRASKVPRSSLPTKSKGKMIFNYDKLVANLNGILVGQYLIRSNLQLTNDDLSGIQQGDKHLYAIIDRLQTNNQTKSDSKFIFRNKVLFKESIIYDQLIYRLCLP